MEEGSPKNIWIMKGKAEFFLNVNVPDLDMNEIKGIRLCDRSGTMVYHDLYRGVVEDGINYIAIGHSHITFEGDENDLRIDESALMNGYVGGFAFRQ